MFQQPLDTLELIFLYVDEPKDLLSIALTCKSLNDLVIPHHIQFRHIRCDYRRLNLWKALAVRPGYGARVRKIEIIQETGNTANVKPVLVPWDFYHTLDPEEPSQRTIDTCIASLAEAVAHMTRLQGFAMTRQVPFSSEFGQVYGKLKDNCTQLRELQVDIQKTQSLSLPNEAQRIFNNVHLPLWELSHITRVSLAISGIMQNDMQGFLVNHCPLLEDLHISSGHGGHALGLYRILLEGNWPHLRRLSLAGLISLYSDPAHAAARRDAVLTAFFQRHPLIECLSFRGPRMLPVKGLPPNVLPRLRSLEFFDVHNKDPLSVIPPEVSKRLEYIQPAGGYENIVVLLPMPSLRILVGHLSMDTTLLEKLVHALPGLERLNFTGRYRGWIGKDPKTDPRISTLSRLPKLTHLAGFLKHLLAGPIPNGLVPILCKIPSLKYVEVPSGKTVIWLVLERNDDGSYKGHHYASKKFDLIASRWGGLFVDIMDR